MQDLIAKSVEVLEAEPRVVFAYLYGSAMEKGPSRDFDIGIYVSQGEEDGAFIESFSMRFREAEGVLAEAFRL